jgi:putative acetyltransferase
MQIRNERPEDAPAVRTVASAAFGRRQEADLVDALRRQGDLAVSLVAEVDGGIHGHVALSRLQSPPHAVALGPVSVIPPMQQRGIGSALVRAALDRARETGAAIVFVLGAADYYGRFGFTVAAAAPFPSSYAGPYFMALAFRPVAAGPVIYAGPFDALG